MQFEVLEENLKKALAVVMPAVAGKSTLSVLSNILLTATDDGRLALAATNLETGIQTSIGARVENIGAVTLPAKLLNDLIAGLPNVPIAFSLDERSQVVTIRAEKFKTELHGIEADEFPVMVTTGGDALFTMPGVDWHAVVNVVVPSASTNIGLPLLQGVHIIGKDRATFEAADSHRLARKTFDRDGAGVDTIIPATSLTMARKVFSADADVSFSTANSGALALFSDGITTLTSRVIDGQYPDLDRIIPTRYTSRIVAPAADLLSTLRLAKLFAGASSNMVRLDLAELDDREGKLGFNARAAEIGEHSSVLDVLATGEPVKTILNIHYLIDAVSACGSGDVAIELQDASRPVVLRVVGDESMLQLLMPMNVR